ncbi:hypothetical protein C1H46_045731 [Malus baccata]|uniref:Uncharacterized protein n=1 Tax=Malus baccata TaxID=106549 RepID=A0A540K3A3_MALBA|nr:hypothetical protein C1H46_045731 [Malus baccata]
MRRYQGVTCKKPKIKAENCLPSLLSTNLRSNLPGSATWAGEREEYPLVRRQSGRIFNTGFEEIGENTRLREWKGCLCAEGVSGFGKGADLSSCLEAIRRPEVEEDKKESLRKGLWRRRRISPGTGFRVLFVGFQLG